MNLSFLDVCYMLILLDLSILILFGEGRKLRNSSFWKFMYKLKNQVFPEEGAGTAE
jgi:hypothetical protein